MQVIKKTLHPRFRVFRGKEITIGPGKADLLEAVSETGSINQAARKLNMSYMRAWKLIRTMNASFRNPVVITSRGGKKKGGAQLTPSGKKILELYQRLETKSMQATKKIWEQLLQQLR